MEYAPIAVSLVIGFIFGALAAWLMFSRIAFPAAKDWGTVVLEAMQAVSNAAVIVGSGGDKATEALSLLQASLKTVNITIDERILRIIIETVYQLQKRQAYQQSIQ